MIYRKFLESIIINDCDAVCISTRTIFFEKPGEKGETEREEEKRGRETDRQTDNRLAETERDRER